MCYYYVIIIIYGWCSKYSHRFKGSVNTWLIDTGWIYTMITKASMWRCFVADITILLALSVFQTIVNANLPPTSDAVPLLG